MTRYVIALAVALVLAVAVVLLMRPGTPSCRTVLIHEWEVPAQWVLSSRGATRSAVPSWALELRELPCRDGVVWTWTGDPPEMTTELER